MNSLDFLTPNANQIRHQIRNIIESYSHDWDVIAELAQNSVDAIRMAGPTKGHMSLSIDAVEKQIVFSDNGCGIAPAELPKLLAPFSTNKDGSPKTIGQKGVGISFVIFSSKSFEVETHHSSGSSRAKISEASSWVTSETDELPKLEFEEIQPKAETGTTVRLKLPSDLEHEIFNLSFNQLEMVLRTKTAIGDTDTIWGGNVDKDVVLKLRDQNGEVLERELDCKYFLPIEKLSPTQKISLREFQEWNDGDKSDTQKRKKLQDKIVYIDGVKEKSGRRLRYWACFVPKRKVWDIVSVNSDLVDDEILQLSPVERIEQFGEVDYVFSGGMFTSTRGMPTGIRTEMKAKGSAGYIPNFFILVDDPMLSFDIGRKSIPGRQLGMLRELSADIFRDFVSGIKKYISGEPSLDDDGWEKAEIFAEVRSLADLKSSKSAFIKRPYNQEASVAAIFFEQLGKGNLEGFTPYVSGYKNRYDLYAKYRNADVVIEFKHQLAHLFRDFDEEAKLFDQIDIVVVWDVTEGDREVVQSRGLDLEEVEDTLTSAPRSKTFHFELTLGPTKPIKIICIRRLLEDS